MAEGKYWDTEVLMPEIQKGEHAKYVVSACTKDGKPYVNIREWYNTQKDPEFKPGRSGMSFPVTKNGDIGSQLIASIQQAIKSFDEK